MQVPVCTSVSKHTVRTFVGADTHADIQTHMEDAGQRPQKAVPLGCEVEIRINQGNVCK